MHLRAAIFLLALALVAGTAALAGFSFGQWGTLATETQQVAGVFWSSEAKEAEPLILSESEVVNLTKPSIVRVVMQVEGEITVPNIDIDLETFEVSILPGTAYTEPVDQTLTGTGFFIDDTGHVMTNAHVVSVSMVKAWAAQSTLQSVVFRKILSLSNAEYEALEERLESFDIEEVQRANAQRLIDAIEVSGSRTITVLDPASTEGKLADHIDEGFVADPVYINGNFFSDEKDVAILKIDVAGTPALTLGSSSGVSVGERVHALGFPSTGEYGSVTQTSNLTESTYSGGTVSALKDSLQETFKVIQTDAKIATGSSGGPLLNAEGQVIGMITSISSQLDTSAGDSFAFAIPVELMHEAVQMKDVSLHEGSYSTHFLAGLDSLRVRHCEDALASFTQAKGDRSDFSVARYVAPYESECEQLIAAGASIDSWWERTYAAFTSTNYLVFVAGAGAMIVTGGVLLVLLHVVHKMRNRREYAPAPVTNTYVAS